MCVYVHALTLEPAEKKDRKLPMAVVHCPSNMHAVGETRDKVWIDWCGGCLTSSVSAFPVEIVKKRIRFSLFKLKSCPVLEA